MSIEATYRRVAPNQFARLLANPQSAWSFLYPGLEEPEEAEDTDAQHKECSKEVFSLGKEWHILHFLLTGESDLTMPTRAPPPLGNVVQGGTPTPFEATYGPVRVLYPHEVRAVTEALRGISVEDLKARFDPEKFKNVRIYPNPGDREWDEEDLDLLLELYPELVGFFTRAAEAGDLVLLSSD